MFLFDHGNNTKIEVVYIFLTNMRTFDCFYTAFQNNFNNYKNSASQSIESIAKIIINAKCMKETFPETFKEYSFRVSTCSHHVQQHGLVIR